MRIKKRVLGISLSIVLALTLGACGQKAEESDQTSDVESSQISDSPTEATSQGADTPTENRELVLGMLSLLNMTEEDYMAVMEGKLIATAYLAEQGVYHSEKDMSKMPKVSGVIFYDTLNAMLMALEAEDITSAEVPVCVADYLCAHNDNLKTRGSYDLSNADEFTKQVAYRLGVGYSFLTTEDKTALRDELDVALTEMKEDGTMDALTKEYITDATSTDPQPVEFTKTEGETVKVAVTGALPPMDYVAADGTPAGFNTAVLAELGRRMNVNFELVQVDSMGRAAALSTGQVDLVFWTNGDDGRNPVARKTKEEYESYKKERDAERTEEQNALMESIGGGVDYEDRQNKDIPDGTITTQPYFNDLLVAVALK